MVFYIFLLLVIGEFPGNFSHFFIQCRLAGVGRSTIPRKLALFPMLCPLFFVALRLLF